MDEQSQKRFDAIVAKDAAALSEDEIAFLNARCSYLSAEQRKQLAAVLTGQVPADGYADLPLAKLKEIAIERGIEFEASAKKADLVSLLEAADAPRQ